ncbi:MAG: Hydantoin racemase [Marmoricola sp.]|nr:Hydantoin racemase [Marmoricola sp.]
MLNPNSDAAMTAAVLTAARAVAAPDTIVSGRNPDTGPAAIESHVDEAFGEVAVARAVAASVDDGVDAYVIACFGDTGRDAARDLVDVPVVGMTEAALMNAALVAHRFTVITLPVRTIAMAERVVRHLGLEHRCTVRAIDLGVGELHDEAAQVAELMIAEALRALADDGAEAIVLGCAGLAGVAEAIGTACGVPVIDGVAAGIGLAESLVRQGLTTSSIGTHARVALPVDLR